MKKPFVSVVIPSYNSKAFISQCLEKILDQSYPKDCYEVIVVDNASTDCSDQIIKSFPVVYLYESKKGPSAARNIGIKNSKGEYILFIDTDCVADRYLIENHIEAHLHFARTDPCVKLVGGGIGGINKNYWAMCDNFCSWYKNHPKLKQRMELRHLPTANLSVVKTVFKEVGMFDEGLRFGEDAMFCKALRQKGYKIYFEPKAIIYHINRTSFKDFMGHAREWAQISKFTEHDNYNKIVSFKNPMLLIMYNIYTFAIRFFELCYSWLSAGKLTFIICFPAVLINRFYMGLHMAKARYLLAESKNT